MRANLIALYVAMEWKAKYMRPRPSQICPALLPPIAVPGHASYPSGHSTQAHLMALCMGAVFDGLTAGQQPNTMPMRRDLAALADRIARNREIAGLHYPSDSQAGVKIAGSILLLMTATSLYQTAIGDATGEWKWL